MPGQSNQNSEKITIQKSRHEASPRVSAPAEKAEGSEAQTFAQKSKQARKNAPIMNKDLIQNLNGGSKRKEAKGGTDELTYDQKETGKTRKMEIINEGYDYSSNSDETKQGSPRKKYSTSTKKPMINVVKKKGQAKRVTGAMKTHDRSSELEIDDHLALETFNETENFGNVSKSPSGNISPRNSYYER